MKKWLKLFSFALLVVSAIGAIAMVLIINNILMEGVTGIRETFNVLYGLFWIGIITAFTALMSLEFYFMASKKSVEATE